MGFASGYLEQRTLFPVLIEEAPEKNTGIIVVVPAFDEPGIAGLLDSLAKCTGVPCSIEILIIINAPVNALPESLLNNELAIENIHKWKLHNKNCFFRVYPIYLWPVPYRRWGVGMARKTGMDEAVRRFDSINNPGGVILNLDADCLVDSNYFNSVYNDFLLRKERTGCSICFEHPLSGDDFPQEIYRYIILYELHLRYYYQALLLSGYPDVYHTVGSSSGVRALLYIKAGGMNRKQAGEDFYFIQKLIPAGGYFSLNSTVVHPSPRTSFRVPFGTGASMTKLSESNAGSLLTYNLSAFRDLKSFFIKMCDFYNFVQKEQDELYYSLPEGIRAFITEKELLYKLQEIRNNTSGYQSFRKRLFGWFNMFMIVKYLNHIHTGIYEKSPVIAAASELLQEKSVFLQSDDPETLLHYYRFMERGN